MYCVLHEAHYSQFLTVECERCYIRMVAVALMLSMRKAQGEIVSLQYFDYVEKKILFLKLHFNSHMHNPVVHACLHHTLHIHDKITTPL